MAALAIPLVVSVHSIVSLDFAASLEPGWQDTIYPPYFVVGALYSGFAMVVVLAAALRWAHGFDEFITHRHFDVIARVLLAASIVMGVSYATEWFWAWYGGERAERHLIAVPVRRTVCAALLRAAVLQRDRTASVLGPALRRNIPAIVIVSIVINIGMWLERILIVWSTLTHDYLPSMWRLFLPSFWDWAMLAGSLGTFMFLFMIFARVLPAMCVARIAQIVGRGARGMSGYVLAEFADARRRPRRGDVAASEAGMPAQDALVPHAVEGATKAPCAAAPEKADRLDDVLRAFAAAVAAYLHAMVQRALRLSRSFRAGGR